MNWSTWPGMRRGRICAEQPKLPRHGRVRGYGIVSCSVCLDGLGRYIKGGGAAIDLSGGYTPLVRTTRQRTVLSLTVPAPNEGAV